MKKYVKIEPIKISTGEQLDELRVEVKYDLGGYRTRRGILPRDSSLEGRTSAHPESSVAVNL